MKRDAPDHTGIHRGTHALLLAITDHSIKDADEAFALMARRELKLVT
ncbi:hypothetical protein RHRU231_450127 [Rhodococcus ruber]|uniref:Uncharacterized protein n=1 Tax=Rhodococcus ruber TaxID=1830 RepID=A0A098BL48_9NOCA|nr:hypothetical protein RHRU231_450127 [Rhodococcus ruber]